MLLPAASGAAESVGTTHYLELYGDCIKVIRAGTEAGALTAFLVL